MPNVCTAGPTRDPRSINAPLPALKLGDARRVKTGLGVAVYMEGRALSGCPLESLSSDRLRGSSGKSPPGKKIAP